MKGRMWLEERAPQQSGWFIVFPNTSESQLNFTIEDAESLQSATFV